MTVQRHREEFEQFEPADSFQEELAIQHLAVARDANEIARSASNAASDAAAAARLQARVAMVALIIAVTALIVSVATPDKIKSLLATQPWLSWFS